VTSLFLGIVQNLIYTLLTEQYKDEKMDIAKYADYFHDGYVNNILHVGNNISFSLESSVIENLDEIADKPFLSDSNTFKGILKIYGIKSFKLGGKEYEGDFQMQYDDGNILDLKIKDNKIFLLVEWKNFPPKVRKTDVSKIEIEAEKISWENIPGLSDDYFKKD
jgi:hypothetical protein